MYLLEHSVINSIEYSTVEFANNNAGYGGAIFCETLILILKEIL